MTYEYLLGTQPTALVITGRELYGAFTELPKGIDALLRLPCLLSLPQDPSGYQGFAQHSLMSIGHTGGAVFDLWTRAFYLEAVTLVRNMLEVLVQIRYFARHRDAYMPHVRAIAARAGNIMEGAKKKIRFDQMFDDVAPGFYRPHYANLLSDMAHGGLASMIMRLDTDPVAKTETPVFGCIYDEKRAAVVLAYFRVALHGLINVALELDPEAKDRDNGIHRPVIEAGLDFLVRGNAEDWRIFPAKQPLLRMAGPLMGWAPPATP
jgi:hypothetical protein